MTYNSTILSTVFILSDTLFFLKSSLKMNEKANNPIIKVVEHINYLIAHAPPGQGFRIIPQTGLDFRRAVWGYTFGPWAVGH